MVALKIEMQKAGCGLLVFDTSSRLLSPGVRCIYKQSYQRGMGEKLAFSVQAHVFQIDQQTKKRWLPSSAAAIRVAYYHDPSRKTYRIIAIDNSKALINSTVTANMNFTKTSPKFGQWSDHRANTVFGLGFSSEKDLQQFVEWFSKATEAARKVVEEKKRKTEEVEKANSNSLAESKLQQQAVTSSSPDAAKNEEAVVMNGDSRKGASSSEPSPAAVGRNGGSADTQLETLRYENNKLKSALTSSAQNVKKWEGEMKTLKGNNAKLTAALKESNQHVAEWKERLQQYKDENAQLKQKISELESGREGEVDKEEHEGLKRDLDELKELLTAVQLDLEARQSDLTQRASQLKDTNTQLVDAKARISELEEENGQMKVRESELEDQLQMAAVASRRKLEEAGEGHSKLGQLLQEAVRLHQSLAANYKL